MDWRMFSMRVRWPTQCLSRTRNKYAVFDYLEVLVAEEEFALLINGIDVVVQLFFDFWL